MEVRESVEDKDSECESDVNKESENELSDSENRRLNIKDRLS